MTVSVYRPSASCPPTIPGPAKVSHHCPAVDDVAGLVQRGGRSTGIGHEDERSGGEGGLLIDCCGDGMALVKTARGSSRPGTFTDADFDRYRAAWCRPGAYTAMPNWYRAPVRGMPPAPADIRIHIPTLLIWGTGDKFLGRELAPASIAHCEAGHLELIETATHCVQHEEPERVNRLPLDFLKAGEPIP